MKLLHLLLLLLLPCTRAGLPEEDMDTVQLVALHGYPVQTIAVTTADGYDLAIHRIPFGRNDSAHNRLNRPAVFLQHGLLASSADWVINLPHQSLGFLLADAGFDVFMGNVRGNVYSREMTNKTRAGKKAYWSFSWDEMARFDLPAMLEKALAVSGQSSLYYVGYSQGTTTMFALLSENPEYSAKIRKFFALAPVGSVGSMKGAISFIGKHFLPEIEFFEREVGDEEFLPSSFFQRLMAKALCGIFSFTNPLCSNVLFQMVGPNTKQLNQTRLLVYLSHLPAGTSTQNIVHWAQMAVSGRTQKYDWMSPELNMAHYGNATPPEYDFSRVNVPTSLYFSDADWMADSQDVQKLLSRLPALIISVARSLPAFNHIDFVYGERAAKEIYREIISDMLADHANRAY